MKASQQLKRVHFFPPISEVVLNSQKPMKNDPVLHVWRFGSQEILPWQMRLHSSQEPEGSQTNCSLCSSMGMLKE